MQEERCPTAALSNDAVRIESASITERRFVSMFSMPSLAPSPHSLELGSYHADSLRKGLKGLLKPIGQGRVDLIVICVLS